MYTITSRENKIYKKIKSLKDKKQRDKDGLFLIEGERGVRDAAKNGLKPSALIFREGCKIYPTEGVKSYAFAPRLFDELAETQTPQGIIGVFPMPSHSMAELAGSENSFVVLCENVRDPGNLGTVIRTAGCAGAEGVVLTKGCCDLFNPKTVRSTVAGIASVPVIRGVEAGEAIAELKSMGYKIAVGALSERTVGLYEADLRGKIAFVAGNEGGGVTEEALNAADELIKIPMAEGSESLNVGVAAAVMMYEKVRQNKKKTGAQ